MNRYKSSLGVAVGVLATALFVAPSASAAAPDTSTGDQVVVSAAAPEGVDAAALAGQAAVVPGAVEPGIVDPGGAEPGTADPGTADAPAVDEAVPGAPAPEESEPDVGAEPVLEPETTLPAPDAEGAAPETVDPDAATVAGPEGAGTDALDPDGPAAEPAALVSEEVTGEPLVRVQPRTEPRWGVDGALLFGATSTSGSGLCGYYGSHPTLSLGSSGAAVKHMQCLLRYYHGYSIVTDGYFGSVTRSIVMKFQAARGLVADGVVGPVTWNALHPY